jgi:hypothetical protein
MCSEITPHPNPTENKPLFQKDLFKVWNRYPEYDESDTVIIDDCPYKMKDNLIDCVILVDPWVPQAQDDDDFLDPKGDGLVSLINLQT